MTTTDQLIGEAGDVLARAIDPRWDAVKGDSNAARHRRTLLAAIRTQPCRVHQCPDDAIEDGWCGNHAPDEAAIIRATRGDAVELHAHERTEAVRRLAAQGMTSGEIARTLHVTERTVARHVRKLREVAA